jgi:hypothetical protein
MAYISCAFQRTATNKQTKKGCVKMATKKSNELHIDASVNSATIWLFSNDKIAGSVKVFLNDQGEPIVSFSSIRGDAIEQATRRALKYRAEQA